MTELRNTLNDNADYIGTQGIYANGRINCQSALSALIGRPDPIAETGVRLFYEAGGRIVRVTGLDEIKRLRVLDLQGRVLMTVSLDLGSDQVLLNLSSFSAGLYILAPESLSGEITQGYRIMNY